jgi:hypothetical protein
VLLALMHVVLVLASRGRFDAIAIEKVKLRKCVCVRECSIGTDRSSGDPRSATISTIDIPQRIHRSPPASQRRNRCTITHMGTRISGKRERVEHARRYITYHLFEMRIAEDCVVDLDRFGSYVGHG